MPISRRRLLASTAGALATAALASACGDGTKPVVVRRFSTDSVSTGPIRLPISLANEKGEPQRGARELHARIVDGTGATVVDDLVATRREQPGTDVVYWAFRTVVDTPGVYELRVDSAQPTALQVFEPAMRLHAVPRVGEALPPFDTPTVDDPRGVDPICSRLEGVCPLHDRTLTDALGAGTPVLYVIGTPAHCVTGVCAPGLEYVIAAHQRYDDAIAMVHADVYADTAGTIATEAVTAYDLNYEPVIFLADSTGTIVDQLGFVWDPTELDESLTALVG